RSGKRACSTNYDRWFSGAHVLGSKDAYSENQGPGDTWGRGAGTTRFQSHSHVAESYDAGYGHAAFWAWSVVQRGFSARRAWASSEGRRAARQKRTRSRSDTLR